MEKLCTLSNSLARRIAPKLAATLAASVATITDEIRLPRAQSSILPPAISISRISLPCVCTSAVISDM